MKIYYHKDLDGKAAANAAFQRLLTDENYKFSDSDFIGVDYKKNLIDPSKIDVDEVIYILDYSFTEDTKYTLDGVLEKTKNIIWYDHHKSSVKFLKENPEYNELIPNKVIDTTRSGAYIAYREMNKSKEQLIAIPRYITLVDDYDRWVHKYPESVWFNAYMSSVNIFPTASVWLDVHNHTKLDAMLVKGKVIHEYNCVVNTRLFKALSYESMIDGHKCIVMNRPGNSTALDNDEGLKDYPIGCVWTFDGETYTYSIYTKDKSIDCSLIAENLGGGGHPGAAGFTSDELLLVKGGELVTTETKCSKCKYNEFKSKVEAIRNAPAEQVLVAILEKSFDVPTEPTPPSRRSDSDSNKKQPWYSFKFPKIWGGK